MSQPTSSSSSLAEALSGWPPPVLDPHGPFSNTVSTLAWVLIAMVTLIFALVCAAMWVALYGSDDLRAKPDGEPKQIGVLGDSAAERYVGEQFGKSVELKGYPEIVNVMKLVEQSRLDATVQDVPVSVFYGRKFPGLHNVGEPVAPGSRSGSPTTMNS